MTISSPFRGAKSPGSEWQPLLRTDPTSKREKKNTCNADKPEEFFFLNTACNVLIGMKV